MGGHKIPPFFRKEQKMRFKKGKEIITTYDIKVQEEYIKKGLKPIDENPLPSQEEVEAVDYYTVKKKPVRKA